MTKTEVESPEAIFADRSGLELFYRDYVSQGVGSAVLCLHGFMRNSRDFEELAPRLAVGRRVIASDLHGRGHSARMTKATDYHFDLLISDMWALLDHLHIERVVVIGTTLGGLMTIEMAGKEPERVAGIVVNDIGAGIPLPALKRTAGHAGNADYSFEEAVARVKEHNETIYPGFGKDDWICLMLRAYRKIRPGRYARELSAGDFKSN